MNRWDSMPAPTDSTVKDFVLVWPDGWVSPPLQEETAREIFMAVNGEYAVQLAKVEGDQNRVILAWH